MRAYRDWLGEWTAWILEEYILPIGTLAVFAFCVWMVVAAVLS